MLYDDDIMPFGKYKGKSLDQVPDSYLIWFLKQDWCDEYPELVEYANRCLDE